MRLFYPFAATLLFLTILLNPAFCQTSVQNFGTGTATLNTNSSNTTTIPNPTGSGTTYARVGSAGGSVNIANPGISGFGASSKLQLQAPTTGSVVKGTPALGYTASTQFYTKFDLRVGNSSGAGGVTSGTWSFYQGAGSMYNDANDFTGSQVFTGLQFVFGSGGTLTTNYRNGSSWTAITTGIAQGSNYTVEIVGNNTASTINYTYNGGAQSVTSNAFHLYINGTKIGGNLNKAQLGAAANISAITFIGSSSAGNAAWLYADDINIFNAIPSAIGSCSSAPSAQATFGTITPSINSAVINFAAGTGGTGRVVKISDTNSFTDPANSSNPTANTVYSGSGQQVVYSGSGTAVTVTGLSASTTYYIAIWEYNCSLGSEIYNTAENTTSFSTGAACATPPATQATFNTATTAYNQITLNFTGSGGTGRVVKFKDTNTAFTDPADNTTPTATAAYTAGTEQVVYNGTGTSVIVTNLLPNTTYYAAIYEYNCAAGNEKYNAAENTQTNTTNICPAPATQATFGSNTTTGTTATVNFAAASGGTGTGRVVKINTSNSFTDPVMGSDPLANAVYSGSGEQVVYKGTGTSVNLSGLTEGTIYYLAIWEYNCSPGYESYNTTENTTTIVTVPNDPVITEGCYDNSTYALTIDAPITGNFTEILLFARAAGTPTNPTGNASAYTGANLNYSSAPVYGTLSRLVYKGAPGTVTVTGLATGTNYTFKAFSYTSATGSKYSSGTQLSQTIVLPEISLPVTTPTSGQVEIVWTNPDLTCIDEVMVVANAGSVVFTPSGNGSAYTANSVYAGSNQVVFKGTTNSVLVTGLTNFTNYCFKIYTRKGTLWSTGVEVCATPSFAQVLTGGDLLLVAVNTAVSGANTDEVCFFSFKDITPGTSIDFTDNGYERELSGLWGETEGTIRFKRKDAATTITAGTTICFRGSGNSASAFDINICGVNDDANWDITSLNGTFGQFNLNATGDQIWMIQNGSWSDPSPGSNDHNVTYTGNALWGWTSTGWEAAPNYASTSGSTLYPNTDCFNTNTQSVTNSDKVKYTGPTSAATQGQWITRVNTPANWTGYSTNANYNAGGSNYWGTCVNFSISAGGYAEGLWTGESDINWFNCSNWQNRRVPDATVNVSIPTTATNNCVVDATAAFSDRFSDIAECNDLDLSSTNDILRMQGTNDVLNVHGNLVIADGAVVDLSTNSTTGGKLNLHGNWDNNNTTADNIDEAGSTITFTGTHVQTIDGDFGNETFYKLTVNKASNSLQLLGPANVSNTLTLTSGKITTTSTNLLTLEEAATVSSTANNGGATNMGKETSYIDGPMGWKINSGAGTERKFPVGKGSVYGPIGVSPRNAVAKTFVAEYFNTPYSNTGNVNTNELDHVSYVEYWDVTCNLNTGNDDDNAQLTLYWRPTSIVSTLPADRQQMRVAHYTDKGTGTKWEREGNADANGAPGYGSDTWGSVTSDWVSSFSPFTLGTLTPNNALPVELIYFSAVKEGNTSLLQWSTALEINSDYFSVERSTDGGNTFTEIAQVSAAGNSTQPLTYFTHDLAPASGLNYYRLRIVDLDGSYEYSQVVTLNFETNVYISVYPNPAKGIVAIESNSLPVSTVRLYDVTGKLVIELHDITNTKSQIDISALPEGIYYLQVNSEAQRETFKLLIY